MDSKIRTNLNEAADLSATKALTSADIHQKIQGNATTKQLQQLLSQHFTEISGTALMINILAIFASFEPLSLRINEQQVLINPNERSVIASKDLSRVIDYFAVAGRHQFGATNAIELEPLSLLSYEALVEQMSKAGSNKQALTTVLWQISDEVLRPDEPMGQHELTLKVNYVPNFAAMRFVPSYTYSVISACLTKPRTMRELQVLFPELSHQQLSRIMLLSILSGISDNQVLLASGTSAQAALGSIEHTQPSVSVNRDIEKANRSGFFQRLLQKLAI